MVSIEQQQAGLKLISRLLSDYRQSGQAMAQAGFEDTPAGMLFLLRVANGESEPIALAVQHTGHSAQSIKSALIAFIEQFSLAGEGDHYRVLSLNPWCTLDEAKEHYRLLIRLFHPDRAVVSRDLAEHYAAQINQSYLAVKQQLSDSSTVFVPAAASAPMRGQPGAPMHDQPRAQSKAQTNHPTKAQPKPVIRTRPHHPAPALAAIPAWMPVWLTPTRIWLLILLLVTLLLLAVYLINKPHLKLNGQPAGLLADQRLSAKDTIVQTDAQAPATGLPENTVTDYKALLSARAPSADELAMIAAIGRHSPESHDLDTPGIETASPQGSKSDSGQALQQHARQAESGLALKAPVTLQTQGNGQNKVNVQNKADLQNKTNEQTQGKVQGELARASAALPAFANRRQLSDKAPPVQAAAVALPPQLSIAPADHALTAPPSFPLSQKQIIDTPRQAQNTVKPARIDQMLPPAQADKESTHQAVTEEELFNLVSHLVITYNKGDLEGFMALLADNVQSEQGVGKQHLRQSYAEVFSGSREREILLKNLQWQTSALSAVGMSNYQVKLVKKGESRQQQYAGTLRLEILKTQDQLKISGFYHLPDMK